MAFIIKLFCGSKIHEQIDQLETDNLRTSDLDEAVNKVFKNLQWQTGFLGSFQKEAIKSILRDRLHAQKADTFGYLLTDAAALSISDPTSDPEKIEKRNKDLQTRFLSYDLYEIRYILKNEEEIKKKLNGTTPACLCISQLGNERISIFNEVHKAAKKELYTSKEDFRKLNRVLSKIFVLTEAQIDEKIYQKYFGTTPTGKIPSQIQRELDSIDPFLRQRSYESLFDDDQTLRNFEDTFNNGIKKAFNKDICQAPQTPKGLKIITSPDDVDNIHERIRKFEKKYLKNSARALDHLSQILSSISHFCHTPRIKSMLDVLQAALNQQITEFVSKAIFENANELENCENASEYLAFIREKYRLHSATHEPLFSALNLNSIGCEQEASQTNRPKLFSIMHSLSDRSAKKIHEYLKAQSNQLFEELSETEKNAIDTMFSCLGEDVFSENSIINNGYFKTSFQFFLPRRQDCDKDLDLNIIKKIIHISYEEAIRRQKVPSQFQPVSFPIKPEH